MKKYLFPFLFLGLQVMCLDIVELKEKAMKEASDRESKPVQYPPGVLREIPREESMHRNVLLDEEKQRVITVGRSRAEQVREDNFQKRRRHSNLNDGSLCSDGAKNGDETDVDCGGSCIHSTKDKYDMRIFFNRHCSFGLSCRIDEDCESNRCSKETHKCEKRKVLHSRDLKKLHLDMLDAWIKHRVGNTLTMKEFEDFFWTVINPDDEEMSTKQQEYLKKELNNFVEATEWNTW
eukprot:snap_masked-scaffold_26-processed-gene-2.42-mRNA-1 protein AED:0.97 eAED:1.00 QI:0/0/0/0.2/1/1/5/0/234